MLSWFGNYYTWELILGLVTTVVLFRLFINTFAK